MDESRHPKFPKRSELCVRTALATFCFVVFGFSVDLLGGDIANRPAKSDSRSLDEASRRLYRAVDRATELAVVGIYDSKEKRAVKAKRRQSEVEPGVVYSLEKVGSENPKWRETIRKFCQKRGYRLLIVQRSKTYKTHRRKQSDLLTKMGELLHGIHDVSKSVFHQLDITQEQISDFLEAALKGDHNRMIDIIVRSPRILHSVGMSVFKAQSSHAPDMPEIYIIVYRGKSSGEHSPKLRLNDRAVFTGDMETLRKLLWRKTAMRNKKIEEIVAFNTRPEVVKRLRKRWITTARDFLSAAHADSEALADDLGLSEEEFDSLVQEVSSLFSPEELSSIETPDDLEMPMGLIVETEPSGEPKPNLPCNLKLNIPEEAKEDVEEENEDE